MRCELVHEDSQSNKSQSACPVCSKDFNIPFPAKDIVSSTVNCPRCNTLLFGYKISDSIVLIEWNSNVASEVSSAAQKPVDLYEDFSYPYEV